MSEDSFGWQSPYWLDSQRRRLLGLNHFPLHLAQSRHCVVLSADKVNLLRRECLHADAQPLDVDKLSYALP